MQRHSHATDVAREGSEIWRLVWPYGVAAGGEVEMPRGSGSSPTTSLTLWLRYGVLAYLNFVVKKFIVYACICP